LEAAVDVASLNKVPAHGSELTLTTSAAPSTAGEQCAKLLN
jgi:hypothetical protein